MSRALGLTWLAWLTLAACGLDSSDPAQTRFLRSGLGQPPIVTSAYIWPSQSADGGAPPTSVPSDQTLFAHYALFDAEGDPLDASVVWFRNNLAMDAGPSIPPARHARGEQWRFTVVPFDGSSLGDAGFSQTVTITNSAPWPVPMPMVGALTSIPGDPGRVLTRAVNLGTLFGCQDEDGDPASSTGYSLQFLFPDGGARGPARSLPTSVTSLELTRGNWARYTGTCVESFAGGLSRSGAFAVPVTGSAPVLLSAGLRPAIAKTASVLTLELGNILETDGDPASVSISWERTSSGRSPVHVASLDDQSQVDPLLTSKGDLWRAVVSVRDGVDGQGGAALTNEVPIANTPPRVDAGYPRVVAIGKPVQLRGQAFDDDADEGNDTLVAEWSQSGGGAAEVVTDGGEALVRPLALGSYSFTLTARDAVGAQTSTVAVFEVVQHDVTNQLPIARVEGPTRISLGEELRLDGASSADADPFDTLTFEWFSVGFPTGAEPVLEIQGAAMQTVPRMPGFYSFALRVSDGAASSERVVATVEVVDPSDSGRPPPCGCSSGPISLAAFGLLALLRRRRTLGAGLGLVLVLSLLGPSGALARPPGKKGKTLRTRPPPASREPRVDSLPAAHALFDEVRAEEALAILSRLLEGNALSKPQRIEALLLRAECMLALEQPALAQKALVEVLTLAPKTAAPPDASPIIRRAFDRARAEVREREVVHLTHVPPAIDTALPAQLVVFDATIGSGAARVAEVTLHHRVKGGQGGFAQTKMVKSEAATFSARVALAGGATASRVGIEYFLRARDKTGALLAEVGSELSPLEVQVLVEPVVTWVEKPLYTRPPFWVAVGLGVGAAVAGGVGIYVATQQAPPPPPTSLGTLTLDWN